ncbi:hypothetical protein KJ611_01865 [Patescibacteria group bacterium]|nr:hypothetical protein [Patescibacteria group bacterium]MBU1705924.1 hypothetical protein [Patescibacteria group bacterium]
MAQNAGILAIKYFFGDLLGGIIAFPIWWYTFGLQIMLSWLGRALKTVNQYTAVSVWIKNLFVPMYGETGLAGRVISFFIRLFMILARGLAFVLLSICVFAFFAFYLAILPLAIIGIIYHLGGLAIT